MAWGDQVNAFLVLRVGTAPFVATSTSVLRVFAGSVLAGTRPLALAVVEAGPQRHSMHSWSFARF